jgi:hypothetical protein
MRTSGPQNVNLQERWMVAWLDHGCVPLGLFGSDFGFVDQQMIFLRHEHKRWERQQAMADYPVLHHVRVALRTAKGYRMARWEKVALLADLLLWGYPQSIAIATAGVDPQTAYSFRDRMIHVGLLGEHCSCGRPFRNHYGVCRGSAMSARNGLAVSDGEKRAFLSALEGAVRDARGRINRRELAKRLGVTENRVRHLQRRTRGTSCSSASSSLAA